MKRVTIVLSLLTVFLLSHGSIASDEFLKANVRKLETPVTAPAFTLKDLGGQKISLRELGGKVVVLHFFSIWCSVCKKQASDFDKLNEEIKDKDVSFLHVVVDGREKELLEYKNKFNISIPILIDKDGSVAKAYGVKSHHETFFIDRKGKIVGKTYAQKDWTSTAMTNLIRYLLKQK